MKLAPLSLLIALGALTGAANAECNRPAAPGEPPDGATAPREEMVSAFKSVAQYNEQMTAYLDCLKSEHETALQAKRKEGDALKSDEQREYHARELKSFEKDFATKHDTAYEELVAFVARFNKEKDEYNERVKKEKEGKAGE
jgi:hypothetical protein